MAAPVVSGVAAMIFSYFPNLNAEQVKDIILKSSTKYTQMVNKPGDDEEMIEFNKLSSNGGIINVLEAIKLAQSLTKK